MTEERIRDMVEKYAIQQGMEDEFEKDINNYTLSIVEKVVGDVKDQIKHDASEPDAFMALHFFLTRIKKEIGQPHEKN